MATVSFQSLASENLVLAPATTYVGQVARTHAFDALTLPSLGATLAGGVVVGAAEAALHSVFNPTLPSPASPALSAGGLANAAYSAVRVAASSYVGAVLLGALGVQGILPAVVLAESAVIGLGLKYALDILLELVRGRTTTTAPASASI